MHFHLIKNFSLFLHINNEDDENNNERVNNSHNSLMSNDMQILDSIIFSFLIFGTRTTSFIETRVHPFSDQLKAGLTLKQKKQWSLFGK